LFSQEPVLAPSLSPSCAVPDTTGSTVLTGVARFTAVVAGETATVLVVWLTATTYERILEPTSSGLTT
jgi:hypothetical protein